MYFDDGMRRLLGKTIPGTSILVENPPGKLMERLFIQYVASHLSSGGTALLVVTKCSAETCIRNLEKLGVDCQKSISEKRLFIIDWYSYNKEVIIGIEEEEGVIKSSRDILNLSISVNRSLSNLKTGANKIAVMDFLDQAVDTYGWNRSHEYVRRMIETLKDNKMVSFLLVGYGLEDDIYNTLESTSDALVRIDKENGSGEVFLESLGIEYEDSIRYHIKLHGERVRFSHAGTINGRKNGTINGRKNGTINGRKNGTINGRKNGTINGRKNGTINGRTNGTINGRTNGAGAGEFRDKSGIESLEGSDGLLDGLAGYSEDIYDDETFYDNISLPSEEGLINGIAAGSIFGPLIGPGEIKDTFDTGDYKNIGRRLRTNKEGASWFKKGFGTVMVMLFLLLLPVILNVLYVQVEERISIDGNFEDWRAVRAYFDPPATHDMGSIDIREYRATTADGFIYMYLQTADDLFQGREVNTIRFFIDVEEDVGYAIGDIYADHMVEIYGWNRELKGTGFFRFNSSRDANDWNGFVYSGGARVGYRNNELEASVWMPYLNGHREPKMFVHTMAGNKWDSSQGRIIPERDSVVGDMGKVGPVIVEPGELFPIISLDTISLSGEAMLDSITVEYNEHSAEYIHSVAIFRGEEGAIDPGLDEPLYQVNDFDGLATLQINDTQDPSGESYVLAAMVSPEAPRGSVVGLRITELVVEEGIGTIQRTRLENVYVHEIPEEPRVDGGFAFWDERHVWTDPMDDLSPIGAWNPNVDIRSYSIAGRSNFLVSVEGNMLGGADVPYIRGRPSELIDSDGDGIPDIHDPFPNDFTNDGTPDSEMLTPEGLPDVDGDGVADWPYGPDKWLNTTIPVHPDIPEEYWGREVSRYIGPVDVPVRTGEDYVRIFIDADGNSSTGYTAPWLNVGAEYMIEITGRNMEITGAEYFRYDGSRRDWSWESLGNVSVASDSTRLETALDTRALGIPENFEVAFVASDWQNNMDTAIADTRDRGLTRAGLFNNKNSQPSATQRLYLRDGQTLLTEKGNNEMDTRVNSGETATWSTPPFAGDFNITSSVQVNLYLVPAGPGKNLPYLSLTIRDGTDIIGSTETVHVSGESWYSFNIDVTGHTMQSGGSLYLDTEVTGHRNSNIRFIFNSDVRDSRLTIPTNTTVSIDDIYTLNEEEEKQNVFYPGDLVDVNADVIHPIDASLISETTLTINDPEGTVVIEDVEMNLKETDSDPPPQWSTFNYSFILDENAPGGMYEIVVTSVDNQGISSSLKSSFVVPSDPGVIVYPDGTATVEPGTWVDYEVNVKNIGNIDDDYQLYVSESTRKWPTVISIDGDAVALDEDGDGKWDWVNTDWDPENTGKPRFTLAPFETVVIVMSKQVDEGANGDIDTTSLYAQSLNYSEVSDSATFTTYTPYPSKTPILYLHEDGYTMDTIVGTSTATDDIATGSTITWTQTPSFERDFKIIDRAMVHLYIIPTHHGWRRPTVTVSLRDSGSEISSFTISSIEDEGWYEFPMVTDRTIKAGNRLELAVTTTATSITMRYDSQEYPARVELNTDTYVRVEDIVTYKDDVENSEFQAGDTVDVRAWISDPFGGHNIEEARMAIYDPLGDLLVDGLLLSPMENGLLSEETGAWFQGEYELDDDIIVGEYYVDVLAIDLQGLEDSDNALFQVPADVEVDPDHEGEGQAGTEVFYEHTITNLGRGNDRFEISVHSSMGYNITLYHDGSVVAVDTGGNGNWDYVDPGWDTTGSGSPDTGWLKMGDHIGITIGIQIPGNAENGTEDVTTLTVTSWRDSSVSDTATDITSVPEYQSMLLPVGVVFALFFGWFFHRRYVFDAIGEEKENIVKSGKTRNTDGFAHSGSKGVHKNE